MSLRLALPLALALLAGCAGLPAPPPPARDDMGDFSLEARFALRALQAGRSPQTSSGRLSWTHRGASDRVLLANPLGYSIAEIEMMPGLARLRSSDGLQRESTDADALIEEITGQRLPVSRLSAWLLGRAGSGARIEADPQGRPLRLNEAGWQVEYSYPDDRANALPSLLNVSRPGDIELKLRIEEWGNGRD